MTYLTKVAVGRELERVLIRGSGNREVAAWDR